jgi:SAM-dependent methyltransferase
MINWVKTPENRLALPPKLDLQSWIGRWDRMQERHLVNRSERFETMARLVRETQPEAKLLLDIGCGTGSVMECLLQSVPGAQVVGVDSDPSLLLLAEKRLEKWSGRACLLNADLRRAEWWAPLPCPFDAVVSATALHWLTPAQLEGLYAQLPILLRPGGIFLNADHVRSDSQAIQGAWEQHREEMRRAQQRAEAEDWRGFWRAYGSAIGFDREAFGAEVVGDWKGVVEQGMPLSWHLDRLRAVGFAAVDCFWRSDCDAIYGGIRA